MFGARVVCLSVWGCLSWVLRFRRRGVVVLRAGFGCLVRLVCLACRRVRWVLCARGGIRWCLVRGGLCFLRLCFRFRLKLRRGVALRCVGCVLAGSRRCWGPSRVRGRCRFLRCWRRGCVLARCRCSGLVACGLVLFGRGRWGRGLGADVARCVAGAGRVGAARPFFSAN